MIGGSEHDTLCTAVLIAAWLPLAAFGAASPLPDFYTPGAHKAHKPR